MYVSTFKLKIQKSAYQAEGGKEMNKVFLSFMAIMLLLVVSCSEALIHRSNGDEEVTVRARGSGKNVQTINAVAAQATLSESATDTGGSLIERLAEKCKNGSVAKITKDIRQGITYECVPMEAMPKKTTLIIENHFPTDNQHDNTLLVKIQSADGTIHANRSIPPKSATNIIPLLEGNYTLEYSWKGGKQKYFQLIALTSGGNDYSDLARAYADKIIKFKPK